MKHRDDELRTACIDLFEWAFDTVAAMHTNGASTRDADQILTRAATALNLTVPAPPHPSHETSQIALFT